MKLRQDKQGSAMLVTMGIMMIVSILLAALHMMAQQQVHSTIIIRDKLKARMIAESGLNLAYHLVRHDFEKLQNFTLTKEFSDGQYTVTSKTFSDDLANRAQLTSVGTCGIGKSIVAVDLENFPYNTDEDSDDDDTYSLDYDMQVGGETSVGAAFHADVNDVFSNGDIDIQKGSTVDENVTVSSAGEVEWDNAPASATIKNNQPKREIYPAALEAAVTAFIDYAKGNGAVYSDGSEIPSSPPGGVAIYTGPDKLILHGTYNGTIIVLGGSVVINAGTIMNGPDGYPSLISLSPDVIKVNGGAVMNGAVLAPNSEMSFLGTATIYGPLLVGQDISGSGTANLYAGSGQGFTLPPDETDIKDKVVITVWH